MRLLEPFFLATPHGRRFCLHYVPVGSVRGLVVYVHPWAEEMNKSRRMAAEMSRRLALQGFAILQLDLAGCGDSEGDFSDATWPLWISDIAAAVSWLKRRYPSVPLTLWGLHLGGLLAAAYAATDRNCSRLLLWAPIANGEQYLTQFLRLRVASQMLASQQESGGTQQLMQQLREGQSVEVAGYSLPPALALPLVESRLANYLRDGLDVEWFELLANAERPVPPVVEKLVQDWRGKGSEIRLHKLQGEAFWSTQEITDVPDLWDVTLQALVGGNVVS